MKKQIVLGLGLAVLAAPAFASKARLQALGEDSNGSFYINDNRNIFLNAAHVNNYSNYVTFETGDEIADTGDDSASNPRAEGGAFFQGGNLVYGVQLGNESNTSNELRKWANVSTEQNNIDLFVGGDAGVKWGANLTYGKVTETETLDSSDVMRTRLGVVAGDLEAFANITLKNEAESTSGDDEFKSDPSYQIGAAYSMNAYKFFAEYRNDKGESADEDAEMGLIRLGAGRTDKLNDKAHLFSKLEVSQETVNVDGTDSIGTDGEDEVTTNVPLTIGLEYDAASWLTLRGSVSQSLYSDVSVKDLANKNLENTTVVNAGASLKFGEMSVDGVIGNNSSTGVDSATGTNGQLRTDTLMSRVSFNYNW